MATEQIQLLFKDRHVPGIDDIDTYMKHGGYDVARKCLTMDHEAIIKEVTDSGLRGRGGAGVGTGFKWNAVPKNWDQPHYLVINADEGEPGTAKDRELMTKVPHVLIEGCIISAWAIRSKTCYIYIRGEYVHPARQIEKAIAQAYDKGLLGKNILGSGYDLDIFVHMGAGSYECGEESALLSSLMGERGMPRHKPPAAPLRQIRGAWDCPTLINNVESIAAIVPIMQMGAAEYAKIGPGTVGPGPICGGASKGTKLVTISGHVKRPGNYEIVLGTPIRELIYDLAGGMKDDRPLKFIIPGGSSTPLLPASFIDTPYDYASLGKVGSMLGSGALIVFDETVSVPALMTRLAHFYAHESCGKCTPCREGTTWLVKIHDRIMAGGGRPGDIDLILDVCNNIFGRSFCALGDAAAMPLAETRFGKGAIYYYRDEYEALIPKTDRPQRVFAPLQMAAV